MKERDRVSEERERQQDMKEREMRERQQEMKERESEEREMNKTNLYSQLVS